MTLLAEFLAALATGIGEKRLRRDRSTTSTPSIKRLRNGAGNGWSKRPST